MITNDPAVAWECVIVGGGAAGLSAALSLGRARRRTLVVDAGRQSNLAAHGVGGLLNHDRQPPTELYARGREELTEYPTVALRDGQVEVVRGDSHTGFTVTLDDGTAHSALRLLLAGGMDYRYPDLPGAAQRWGSTVFHCPFCHGWEVAGRPLAVLNPDPAGVHQALLLTAWSDRVTLLAGGAVGQAASVALSDEDRARLAAAGVGVEERPVAALHGPESELEAIELADGTHLACGGMLVATTLHQRSDLAARLGIAFAAANPMTAEAIEIDMQHRTTVPGIYAAGDITAGPPSVARAIAQGNFAGAMIVAGLTGSV
ncbi:MAG TPA: NAD(P)/FAD-dependent oxidoreductase [Solirubrobacteraceae bacterium]|nr:NAD(P)/FAD-dependent oxidoreductase [Solirubrobacteraceae bacterium]